MKGEQKKFYKKLIFCIFFNNVTFIQTSNPALGRSKEFTLSLKVAHKRHSFIDPFQANNCSAFLIVAPDNSSRQVSDEKHLKIFNFNQSKTFLLEKQFSFCCCFFLNCYRIFWLISQLVK